MDPDLFSWGSKPRIPFVLQGDSDAVVTSDAVCLFEKEAMLRLLKASRKTNKTTQSMWNIETLGR